jgi:putative Ca2+/H+ antiporter (TMEM165/GDT1 family)
MNLAIALSVFPIIFFGELPDKTMFASLAMSTRGRPRAVFLGVALAFALHVILAVTVGSILFRFIPHRLLEAIVAALFYGGAALAIRELRESDELPQRESEIVNEEFGAHRRTFGAAFLVIFLAEWGDLTQLLTANLAAHYHNAISVGIGAIVALWSVAAIAIFGGRSLAKYLHPKALHLIMAVALTVLAVLATVAAIR